MSENTVSTFCHPLIVDPDSREEIRPEPLDLSETGQGKHDEDWLQDLIYRHPGLLPIDEVEPAFSGIVPVCRELPTAVGPLDNVYINERGLLTLVECKLWRNPEARRKVVGQILDYAQQISRWSCSDFDEALRKAEGVRGGSLWEIAAAAFGLKDEAIFLDRVQHHLSNGTFLLLVVGDGIRRNTEEIANFLGSHAGMSFSLGLVEMALFRMDEGSRLLVQPRVLAKTVEIGRMIVRAEAGTSIEQVNVQSGSGVGGKRQKRTLTEQMFIEEVAGNSPLAGEILSLFAELSDDDFEIVAQPSGASLKIVEPNSGINLLTMNRDGTIRNHGCGKIDAGRAYLNSLALLLGDGKVDQRGVDSGWSWTVMRRNGGLYRIEDLLQVRKPWLELLGKTRRGLQNAE